MPTLVVQSVYVETMHLLVSKIDWDLEGKGDRNIYTM